MSPQLKLTQFNGTIGRPSKFTGDPSPELDAVWAEYSDGTPSAPLVGPNCAS